MDESFKKKKCSKKSVVWKNDKIWKRKAVFSKLIDWNNGDIDEGYSWG